MRKMTFGFDEYGDVALVCECGETFTMEGPALRHIRSCTGAKPNADSSQEITEETRWQDDGGKVHDQERIDRALKRDQEYRDDIQARIDKIDQRNAEQDRIPVNERIVNPFLNIVHSPEEWQRYKDRYQTQEAPTERHHGADDGEESSTGGAG